MATSEQQNLLRERSPQTNTMKMVLRILYSFIALFFFCWGLNFVLLPHNAQILSGIIFFGFFIFGLMKWNLAIAGSFIIAPIFLLIPNKLGYQTYSVFELGILGLFSAGALHLTMKPRWFKLQHPISGILILLCLTGLLSASRIIFNQGGFFNSYFYTEFWRYLVSSIQQDQFFFLNIFSSMVGLIESVIFFHIVLYALQNKGNRTLFLTALTISGCLVTTYGLFQYLFLDTLDFWKTRRINSFLTDPNSCASFLLLTLGATIALRLTCQKTTHKHLLTVICIFQFAAILLTVSHIAWLAAAIACGWMIYFIKKDSSALTIKIYKKRKFLITGIILIYSIGWIFIINQNSNDSSLLRWMDGDHTVSKALRGRLGVWRRSFMLIENNPWFGVGPGRTFQSLETTWKPKTNSDDWNPVFENAHNQYLQFATELGFMGGLLLLIFMALVLYRLFQSANQNQSRDRFIPIALGSGWLAFSITMLTGHPLIMKEMLIVYLGVTAILFKPASGDEALLKLVKFQRFDPLLLPALILILSIIPVTHVISKNYSEDDFMSFHGIDYRYNYNDSTHYSQAGKEVHAYFRKTTPDMRLEFNGHFCEYKTLKGIIWINNQKLQSFEVNRTGWQILDIPFPAELIGDKIILKIEFDDFIRPNDFVPENRDRRPMTVEFRNFIRNLNYSTFPLEHPSDTSNI